MRECQWTHDRIKVVQLLKRAFDQPDPALLLLALYIGAWVWQQDSVPFDLVCQGAGQQELGASRANHMLLLPQEVIETI